MLQGGVEAKCVHPEQERFAFQQHVAERNDARALRQYEQDANCLSFDQRRIEIEVERAGTDREERSSAMEERKGMLAVLDELVKKLQ